MKKFPTKLFVCGEGEKTGIRYFSCQETPDGLPNEEIGIYKLIGTGLMKTEITFEPKMITPESKDFMVTKAFIKTKK